MAQLMIASRLIELLSEWALIDWSQRTAFILDEKKDLDLRLTAFIILRDVDPAYASAMGKRVLQKEEE